MKVYHYDLEGYYTHSTELDNSDKCQITGDWIIPGMATEKELLEEKEGFEVRFLEGGWQYKKILTVEEKKIQGLIPLEEGEKIQDNVLVKVEKPSEIYSWDFELKLWVIDESRVKALEIDKAKKLTDFYELAIELGLI